MNVTRREFIQITGANGCRLAVSRFGNRLSPSDRMPRCSRPSTPRRPPRSAVTAPSVAAPSCLQQGRDGACLNLEGGPDHIINKGALCAKGASLNS
jgi:formate dehydrogenase major subunit